ncbi:hypothetical protein Q5424_00910 [Conexibacter sp. JD483]|uniref:hypothetical protein n=1 Tax=unclassified Conexibacter TaxID=2627773 RepID=UPI002719F706|nr:MULTISPECIES: hypothetical protein [unclassified Conexibacter]MDO8189028.1 hypothetical protein [Conexibacter sp. CPCC 205706]MDO8198531.1 hypothetical protein [Conexibacter sp. CPCC 205762]MDR9367617.1 hypothetical protein [Conexibacter sp. JD483]
MGRRLPAAERNVLRLDVSRGRFLQALAEAYADLDAAAASGAERWLNMLFDLAFVGRRSALELSSSRVKTFSLIITDDRQLVPWVTIAVEAAGAKRLPRYAGWQADAGGRVKRPPTGSPSIVATALVELDAIDLTPAITLNATPPESFGEIEDRAREAILDLHEQINERGAEVLATLSRPILAQRRS